jgi:hypothetical protein
LLREAKASVASLAHDFAGVTAQTALPVTGGGSATVIAPNRRQLQMYSDGRAKTCGGCKHFDLEAGRKKMIEERFLERLTHEQQWKLHHLGAKVDEIGLCGESGGTMVVSFMANACDHFTERR